MQQYTPGVDIVTVNTNDGENIKAMLRSVPDAIRDVRVEKVVIVDNGSTDMPLEELRADGVPVVIERNGSNRGFAFSCNRGARAGTADYVLLLNPDTRLFESSLRVPLHFLEDPANATVGIVGVQLVDESGAVQRSTVRFPTPALMIAWMLRLDALGLVPSSWLPLAEHHASRDVDQVMGAFFLVRRTVWEQLGGLDQRYFLYYEELDFALRAAQRGIRSRFLAEGKALHHGEGSTSRIKARRLFYSMRSRLYYVHKHFGWSGFAAILAASLVLEPATRVAHALLRLDLAGVRDTLSGWGMFVAALPEVWSRVRAEPRPVTAARAAAR